MNGRGRPTGSHASASPDKSPPRRPVGRREVPRVERIVVLRILGAIVLLAFLALIVKGALLAFGTPDQQAKRIDAAVDGTPRAPAAVR